VKKELRPVHDNIACDVCGRTILKGERTEAFLAPGGRRHQVCDLCFERAESAGWIRESAAGEQTTRVTRPEPRRPLLGRLLRKRAEPVDNGGPDPSEEFPEYQGEPAFDEQAGPEEEYAPPPEQPPPPPPRSRPKDPRHVRAVPTTAAGRVERALELFNASDHHRTVAGLTRTLGTPWVTALPDAELPSTVTVLVAWELSWYRYRIDLGDAADAVVLLEKGEEIEEIDDALREWNSTVDADGSLVSGIGSGR